MVKYFFELPVRGQKLPADRPAPLRSERAFRVPWDEPKRWRPDSGEDLFTLFGSGWLLGCDSPMDTELLIHSIVRQTTVLIAQISTAVGFRAPLAHVANQVFLDLARELEAQGVRRNVVADMFGLALRSYQLKFQRAVDSAAVQRSLWRDVHTALGEGVTTRTALEARFPRIDPKGLRAVLNDLVDSGFAYRSGRGPRAVYGLTPREDLERLTQEDDELSLAHVIWLSLATRGTQDVSGLAKELGVDAPRVEAALAHLISEGRVAPTGDGVDAYDALSFDIPVGSEQGWEAAVCDHFRAVSNAIAAKLEDTRSRSDDRIGGTTLSFSVYQGHPRAAEIYGLLGRFRSELNALWEDASAYNNEHAVPEAADRVTFYFGQNVVRGGEGAERVEPSEAGRPSHTNQQGEEE